MPRITVGEVVDLVGGTSAGDQQLVLQGVRGLAEAGPEDLSFLSNPIYEHLLPSTRAGAVLVEEGLAGDSPTWIRVRNPQYALSRVMQKWFSEIPRPEGISPRAIIASTAKIGERVRIGPFVTVGDGAVIGDDVTLFDGVYVGPQCLIGHQTLIHPRVVLYHRTSIGMRCIIHSGVVIGADGFGFATHEGVHHKIPQIGRVRIEDDVEIGAGTTIDRAAIGETVIGEGTKIDNQVMIGHNARIGRRCLIVAQVAIAGSVEIGDYCVLAGHAGVAGHIVLGQGVMVAAKSAVMKDWEGPVTLAGNPARPLREHLRSEALVRRLPEMRDRLAALERHLGIDRKSRQLGEEKDS